MQIIDKYIQSSKLTLLFDEMIDASTVTVGIDNASNYRRNLEDKKHDAGSIDVTPSGRSVEVTVPTDLDALIIVTVYIGEDKYTTMFLNQYMLYRAQNRYLTLQPNVNSGSRSCETSWRTKAIAILLRTRLLEYAYANGLVHDAINYYIDLTRVLDFKNVLFESIPEFYNNINNYGDAFL